MSSGRSTAYAPPCSMLQRCASQLLLQGCFPALLRRPFANLRLCSHFRGLTDV